MDNSSENGSIKRSQWFRKLRVWKYFCEYFPIRLHKSTDLDPNRTYVMGYHPHGFVSLGAFGNFATEGTDFEKKFPGITNSLLTLNGNFRVPLYKEYLQACGLSSVSRRSCEALLWYLGVFRTNWRRNGPGSAITIVIGGAEESLHARPGVLELVLRKRHGFIRLAIESGSLLVPILSFGENGTSANNMRLKVDLYDQAVKGPDSKMHKFQEAVKKLTGFTTPVVWARGVFNYDFGLMPWRHEINTVGRLHAVCLF